MFGLSAGPSACSPAARDPHRDPQGRGTILVEGALHSGSAAITRGGVTDVARGLAIGCAEHHLAEHHLEESGQALLQFLA